MNLTGKVKVYVNKPGEEDVLVFEGKNSIQTDFLTRLGSGFDDTQNIAFDNLSTSYANVTGLTGLDGIVVSFTDASAYIMQCYKTDQDEGTQITGYFLNTTGSGLTVSGFKLGLNQDSASSPYFYDGANPTYFSTITNSQAVSHGYQLKIVWTLTLADA